MGTPLQSFSTIQHHMLNEGIYEDRCTVSSFSSTVTDGVDIISGLSPIRLFEGPILCEESRIAYINVYDFAAVAFALAIVPAYFSARYLGFSFTNLCLSFLMAAGSVIISDQPEEEWVTDRFKNGYALVAASGAFAYANAVNMAMDLSVSNSRKVALLTLLVAVAQLSPLFWTTYCNWYSKSSLSIRVVFQDLLYVPCVGLLLTLVLMPISVSPRGNLLAKLVDVCMSQLKDPAEQVDPEVAPLLDSAYKEYQKEHHQPIKSVIFSWSFVLLTVTYVVQTIPLDILILDGEARQWQERHQEVWRELALLSPVISACMVAVIFVIPKLGLLVATVFPCLLSIAITAVQWWEPLIGTYTINSLVGSTHIALSVFATSALVKWCGMYDDIRILAIFMLIVTTIKTYVIPPLGIAIELNASSYAYSPFLYILSAQALLTALTFVTTKYKVVWERRERLELEAQIAFDRAG